MTYERIYTIDQIKNITEEAKKKAKELKYDLHKLNRFIAQLEEDEEERDGVTDKGLLNRLDDLEEVIEETEDHETEEDERKHGEAIKDLDLALSSAGCFDNIYVEVVDLINLEVE